MKLTRQQQKVYDLLSTAPGYLTWRQIALSLWDYEKIGAQKHVSVLICRLRKAGVQIEHGGRNQGWRIAQEKAA